jgi:hypothetical protein
MHDPAVRRPPSDAETIVFLGAAGLTAIGVLGYLLGVFGFGLGFALAAAGVLINYARPLRDLCISWVARALKHS